MPDSSKAFYDPEDNRIQHSCRMIAGVTPAHSATLLWLNPPMAWRAETENAA
jgi:hypothetical protein